MAGSRTFAGRRGRYTDSISPRFASAALIAALDYRDRTGKGQLIDLAQFEPRFISFCRVCSMQQPTGENLFGTGMP